MPNLMHRVPSMTLILPIKKIYRLMTTLPHLRLRASPKRIVCLISLSRRSVRTRQTHRELAVVASRSAPHLRYLTVYRQLIDPRPPMDGPRAA